MKKFFTLTLAAFIAVVFSGCGTLFWSERKSEPASDRIDAAVLILDCCALLVGIIPGVVALVLDFNNGTIYYSQSEINARTASADLVNSPGMVALQVENMDQATIEAALSRELGRPVSLNDVAFVPID